MTVICSQMLYHSSREPVPSFRQVQVGSKLDHGCLMELDAPARAYQHFVINHPG